MNEVKFVSEVLVQTLPLIGRDEIRYYTHDMESLGRISDGEWVKADRTIKERVVPITRICGVGRNDLYIAYSVEVEELLGVPIRALKKEREEAEVRERGAQIALRAMERYYRDLSFWQRLKFLFKGAHW